VVGDRRSEVTGPLMGQRLQGSAPAAGLAWRPAQPQVMVNRALLVAMTADYVENNTQSER
jgi:hypothetical protein